MSSNPYQTLSLKPKEKFRDIDMNFGVNPVSGDVLTKNTEQSIKQALTNIVLTNFYERPFQCFIGSQVTGSLFEHYSVELELFLREHIYQVLTTLEPRADILDVRVGTDQTEETVRAQVDFAISGILQQATLDIVFERIR